MASIDNDIVRRGYFNVLRNPRAGLLSSISTLSSKRHWVILRKQVHGRPACIEMYKNEDQATTPGKIVTLDKKTFKSVQTNNAKKAFILHLRDDVCMFQCASRADMEDWCRDIQFYSGNSQIGDTPSKSVSKPVSVSREPDVFDGVPDDETYRVNLRKSNTIVYQGPCLLEILRDFDNNRFHIALFTEEELPRLIVKWQIDHIRQYGSNQSAFKFESGRKSSTGVDWFILDTEVGAAARIHRAVDYWAKHIVEQVSNTSSGTLPLPLPQKGSSPTTFTPLRTNSMPHTNPLSDYQPLLMNNRTDKQLYATTNVDKSPKPTNKKNIKPSKPPAQDPSSSMPARGFYQPLQPVHSTYTTDANSVYEQLNQGTRSNNSVPPSRPPTSSDPRNPTYMGLSAQTRLQSEVYMGLEDARS